MIVLQKFLLALLLSCASSAQEDSCQNGCKHKLEYCDAYESKCQPCEVICLPPTNQKFAECGQLCPAFLQDILIEHYNEPKHQIHLDTVESLLIIVTCVTIIILVGICVLIIFQIMDKGSKRGRTDVMPLYQLQSVRTVSTNLTEDHANSTAINSRIPCEDRAPSQAGCYDNPLMVPSPTSTLRRT